MKQIPAKQNNRIILHLDMDYFFAQVEERENPYLKIKPVVIGADPKGGKGRGIVSTCNYIARKFGIKSGMPISWAYEKCSHAFFLPPNFALYEKASQNIMEVIKKYSPIFEPASIDEAYLDLSHLKSFKKAKEVATKIKAEILEKEKLTSSIGLGPNKLIAKIASDFQKPNGLTIIEPNKVLDFLSEMSIRKIPGIGPKTETKLNALKVFKISDLQKMSRDSLIELLGKWGSDLWLKAQGLDENPVVSGYVRKSIGAQTTFPEDKSKNGDVLKALLKLAREVLNDCVDQGNRFQLVEVTIRYAGFETHTHSKTLKKPATDFTTLRSQALQLAWPFLQQKRKIRLVGIRLAKLKPINTPGV